MSLSINEENIIGLYALNQWFKVIKGSFNTLNCKIYKDGNFFIYLEREARRELIFSMGVFYPEIDSQSEASGAVYAPFPINFKDHPVMLELTRDTGITFIDADTGERISFALLEVKAFREDIS